MKSCRVLCALMMLCCTCAQATVSLSGTRLVFDGRYREATLEVRNPDTLPVLIQAWLQDPQDPSPAKAELPFVVTPHLVQLPGAGRQVLRVLYEGVGRPVDRESLLHLYVLQIPRRSEAKQQLAIAVRQRINVFYRPSGLAGEAGDAAQALVWQWRADARPLLRVNNPTAYHVTLQDLTLGTDTLKDHLMLAPFSEAFLPLPDAVNGQPTPRSLRFKALTDYGGQREFCGPAQPHDPFNTRLHPVGAPSPAEEC